MPSRRIEFTGSRNARLAGRLDTPDTPPRGWALFAHCFTCSKDSKAAVYIARSLAEAGFGVLRFDFTGLGGSGGDFENTDFSSNVDDLVAAADWLHAQHGAPVALLVGHSLGGAAVLAAAHRIADARAVATIGAPFDPAHVTRLFAGSVAQIEKEGEAVVQLADRRFRIRRSLLDDLNRQQQAARIHALRRPLLVLHSPHDAIVPIDDAGEIFRAALHPKSFVSLDDADHLLVRETDARYAAGVIAAWAGRYIGDGASVAKQGASISIQQGSAGPTVAATAVQDDGKVHVSERGTGAFTVAISAGRHSWLGDEPVSAGGDDLGPNPYDMLCAALGACTAMTLRMYARRKQWPLAHVAVVLEHSKIHAADCAECETRVGKIDRIEREIRIDGDQLDDAQRQRLLEIADMCPVHRTLHSEVQIVTRAADWTDS